MDIEINNKQMTIYANDKVAKQVELDKDSFKKYMIELSGNRVDMLREATRLFKCKSYRFKDVRL